jgi:ribosome biogenesis GTPase
LRGRLKKGRREGDVVGLGDWVRITPIEAERGVIDEIEPRKRLLSRMAPLPSGEYQQIIIANPDQAVFVFACLDPAPRFGMLDRYLVIAEKQNVPALIVANKIDLVSKSNPEDLFGIYTKIGYPVIYTSVVSGKGIVELKDQLVGKISVLSGPSGVGKSSLLNVMIPGIDLANRAVSQATSKGRHTTVAKEMYPLAGGGYIADTPGLKALALWDMEPDELDGYFPELREWVSECQFNDCTHEHEPGCAVQAAVISGRISRQRYESYLRMRISQEEEYF